jgi:hypothetical protein
LALSFCCRFLTFQFNALAWPYVRATWQENVRLLILFIDEIQTVVAGSNASGHRTSVMQG